MYLDVQIYYRVLFLMIRCKNVWIKVAFYILPAIAWKVGVSSQCVYVMLFCSISHALTGIKFVI